MSTDLLITIKAPSDSKFTVKVPSTATVLELKQLIESTNSELPAGNQRLIYSGRVLKDESLISSYQLKDGNTVHLVGHAQRSHLSLSDLFTPALLQSG